MRLSNLLNQHQSSRGEEEHSEQDQEQDQEQEGGDEDSIE
jgi:hypothetical protein